jgi:hypothetical protein
MSCCCLFWAVLTSSLLTSASIFPRASRILTAPQVDASQSLRDVSSGVLTDLNSYKSTPFTSDTLQYHGTTTIAMAVKEGVVVAVDSRWLNLLSCFNPIIDIAGRQLVHLSAPKMLRKFYLLLEILPPQWLVEQLTVLILSDCWKKNAKYFS